ncbi:MAG: glycerol-3-phosphate 1-O-acyltransferase PlsY [Nitrospinae bacterium]|nr:glycerol-3-phosphate 1-O-acyltransferase PlsY [Nitrospinota bacterium]
MTMLAAALIASYLAGSIPTALIAGKMAGGIDIRKHGSGNAGATNVYRLFGMKPYLAVLSLDMFKGFIAVTLIAPFGAGILSGERTALYCGLAAVAGHIWTVFAGFKGGKGVATAAGIFLGLSPVVTLLAVAIYLAVTLTTKYVSLGSMTAAISAPILLLLDKSLFHPTLPAELAGAGVALAALIVFTHRENIKRLLKGEERKTDFLESFKSKSTGQSS